MLVLLSAPSASSTTRGRTSTYSSSSSGCMQGLAGLHFHCLAHLSRHYESDRASQGTGRVPGQKNAAAYHWGCGPPCWLQQDPTNSCAWLQMEVGIAWLSVREDGCPGGEGESSSWVPTCSACCLSFGPPGLAASPKGFTQTTPEIHH